MQMRRGAMVGRNWTLTAGEQPVVEMRWKWPTPGNTATLAAEQRHWKLDRVRHEPQGSFVALDQADGSEVVLVAICVHALQYRGSHRPSHIGDQMTG